MLRVLEVISDMNIGGAGRLLINRIKNTDKEKVDITVVIPKGSLLKSLLVLERVNLFEINGGKDSSFDIKGFFAVASIIRKLKPDIVNAHGSLSARIAAKICGVKVKIFTRHCDFPISRVFKIRIVKKCFSAINDFLSDGIIAVSDSAKVNLCDRGIKKEKIRVIINGVCPIETLTIDKKDRFKKSNGISSSAVVISIFARLEPYKDHVTFLKAAALLKDKNFVFAIVGTGSEEKKIKALAKELDLDKKVIFTGFVFDVTEWMNVTDINVNCSTGTETSSLALSEGMSLGVPAIASDYSGNVYMVENGVNGMIFPQRDPFSLAEKIEALSQNKELYNSMKTASKERFEKELNAVNMTRKTEEYYLELYEMLTKKRK